MAKMANSIIINGEAAAVLAAMRSTLRWASNSRYAEDELEDPLLEGLKAVRRKVFSIQDWSVVEPLEYLEPFLQVVKSPETAGTVTDVALYAVLKILNHGVVEASAVGQGEAMQAVAESVTQCKFEATYPSFDECVLSRILDVLVAVVRSPLGRLLSHDNLISIFQACYRIGHYQTEKGRETSELLTQASRRAMARLVRIIFLRLETDEPPSGGMSPIPSLTLPHFTRLKVDEPPASAPPAEAAPAPAAAATPTPAVTPEGAAPAGEQPAEREEAPPATPSVAVGAPDAAAEDASAAEVVTPAPAPTQELISLLPAIQPHPVDELDGGYGIDAVREVLFFIISLIGAGSGGFHRDLPAYGLDLMLAALQAAGPVLLAHESLLALLQEDLIKSMFAAASNSSLLCLSGICQVALALFTHMGRHFLLQVEALLGLLLIPLAEGRGGVSVERQQVALEGVLDFCCQPGFIHDIYLSLDCRIERSDLFEQICALLSKAAFPVNGPLGPVHILSLDGITAILAALTEACSALGDSVAAAAAADEVLGDAEQYVDIWTALCHGQTPPVMDAVGGAFRAGDGYADIARVEKRLKARLITAADHFNRDQKKGFQYLQSARLLPQTLDPTAVAGFLRCCPGLVKAGIGEVIGERDPFYDGVRTAFMETFDFAGLDFVMALRLFMDAFRPPGEGQKIDRIMQVFGQRYFDQMPGSGLKSADAAYVLAFSVMMLNTDLHNTQNKKKMSLDDFTRINDNTNDGEPMPRELLNAIYEGIAAEELKITAECAPEDLPGQLVYWTQIARQSRRPRGRMLRGAAPSAALERDLFALAWGPTLAAASVILDNSTDAGVAQRATDALLAAARLAAFHDVEEVADQVLASLAKYTAVTPALGARAVVAFGESAKARAAMEATFAIANRYGDCLRSGWRPVLEGMLRLHKLGLLPPAVIAADGEDLAEAAQRMPEPAKTARGSSGSLFSRAFNSLISIDAADPANAEQATAREQALTEAATACVQASRVEDVVGDSKFLTSESLVELVKATMWAGGNVVAAARTGEQTDTAELCLELLITLALRNRDRVALIWPLVHEYLAACTAADTAEEVNPLVERAVLGLLRVCQRLLPYKEDTAEMLLASLRLVIGVSAGVAWELAERIAVELAALLKSSASYVESEGDWRTVCALVRLVAVHPAAAPWALEAMGAVCGNRSALSGEAYMPLLETCLQMIERYKGSSPQAAVQVLDMIDALMSWLLEQGAALAAVPAGEEPAGPPPRLTRAALVELWLTTVGVLTQTLCRDASQPLRDNAIATLHRALLASDSLHLPAEVWVQTTQDRLISLVYDLAVLAASGKAAAKTHPGLAKSVRLAVNLLTKCLLQYAALMSTDKDFYDLWSTALATLQDCMRVQHESLLESVPENAKNLLLVLVSSGVLTPQWVDAQGRSLWDLTWAKARLISSALTPQLLQTAGLVEPANSAAEAPAAAAAGEGGTAAAEAATAGTGAAVAGEAPSVASHPATPVTLPARSAATPPDQVEVTSPVLAAGPAGATAASAGAPGSPPQQGAGDGYNGYSEGEQAEQAANGCKQS